MQDFKNSGDSSYRVYFDIGTSNSSGFLLEGSKILDQLEKEVGSKDAAIEMDQELLKREI